MMSEHFKTRILLQFIDAFGSWADGAAGFGVGVEGGRAHRGSGLA